MPLKIPKHIIVQSIVNGITPDALRDLACSELSGWTKYDLLEFAETNKIIIGEQK